MADTDVIGIVSLLLAAGGAAYLFRARLIGGGARAEPSAPTEPPPESQPESKVESKVAPAPAATPAPSAAREAATLPPTLRASGDRPRPKKSVSSAKTTTPESPAAKALPPPDSSPEIDKLVDSKPPTKPEQHADEAPTMPPPKDLPPPQERIIVDVDLPKITPAPVTVPEKKTFKKQTIVGLAGPAMLDVVPMIDLVPKLDFEEDEDVEPTRVGRYERQSIRPPVEKHIFDEGADSNAARTSAPLALAVYALAHTDPGKRRKQNEDSYLIREIDGLYVVADGMGGHKGGQHASKLAVDTMDTAFEKKVFDAEAHGDLPPAASELARAIQMANSAILNEAAVKSELHGMGTTLCAARFFDANRRLFLGHVGDSRCYRVRGGTMKQMTTDHTMADYGVAGPEGAHLSRALGVWPTVPIDIIMAAPALDDVYLLCSDGLTKMLPNETIATQLLHEEDPKAAVERLVFFANAHGGKDNITVILLRVVEVGWVPPSERTSEASA